MRRFRFNIGLALVAAAVAAGSCTPRQAGLRAVERGELETGVKNLKEALRLDPGDSEAQRELGLAYLRLHDAPLAERHLREAARLDPEDRRAGRFLALARERLGWQALAAESWEGLARDFPRDRLGGTLRLHAARYRSDASGLTPEAAQNRVDALRERGLLDNRDIPRPILVLPFAGPPVYPEYERMARTLGRALAADLARMDLLWVIGPDQALSGMKRRGLTWDPNDASGSTQRIGRAFGAGLVVRGTLLRGFEDELRADVALVVPDPPTLLLDSKIEGTARQFPALQREVLDRLLSAMGVLPGERERARLGRFDTEDLSALGRYLDGVEALAAGEHLRALELLQGSVALDADFPCAHRALAMICRLLGRREQARAALLKGQGRGNPRCVGDARLLEMNFDTDTALAGLLQADLEQGRTILRDGLRLMFVIESEPTARTLRHGHSGSRNTTPAAVPTGWIWYAESFGRAGIADPSSLGGVKGSSLTAPDPSTSGQGGF